MKNAMKKIMSLVLVAMILVSALPFAASADGEEPNFWIELNLDGNHIDSKSTYIPVGTTMDEAAIKHYAEGLYGEYFGDGYVFAGCYAEGGQVGDADYMGAGIKFETKPVTPPAPPAEPDEPADPEMVNFWIELNVDGKHVDSKTVSVPAGTVMDEGTVKLYAEKHLYGAYFGNGYTYEGCYDFGGKAGVNGYIGAGIMFKTKSSGTTPSTPSTPSNPGVSGSNQSGYHKLSGTVTLRIQMKGSTHYKDIAIKDGIAADGAVNMKEVRNVVNYYYNAIDGDDGILIDGIYIDDSVYSLWMSYVHDSKYNTVEGLYEAAYQNNDVRLTVVIDNAKLASNSSSKADSSNPKTGDMIMAPVAIMTVSASLLAVAFYMNKKRAF